LYSGGKFILAVSTFCKSAGTLLALGANEIVMTDSAELGPLDVQVLKKDEMGERTSGLTPIQALSTLQVQAFDAFQYHFDSLYQSLGNILSTGSLTQIASRLTVGCFNRIYEQVDPMKLAEFQRAVLIAKHYGVRLSENMNNLKEDTIDRLITDYPSHEFVIDRREAGTLFCNVRSPKPSEQKISDRLFNKVMEALADDKRPVPWIEVLSVESVQGRATANRGDGRDRRKPETRKSEAVPSRNGSRADRAGQPKPTADANLDGESVAVPDPGRPAKPRRANGRKRDR
jgi:Serine dehydrogenase proteinase